jgi:hypothetical protein
MFEQASDRGYDVGGGYYAMTAEEMREQKMRLRIELEDAEARLAALREKARVRADRIIQFGTWLKEKPELHIYRQGHSVHHDQPLDKLRLLQDSDIEVLQLTPSLEIANSIRKELANIADLKERVSRL